MTLDFVFKTCTGRTPEDLLGSGDLDWYERYANPRDDSGKGVLTANWNHFPRMAASDSYRSPEGKSAQDYNWGKGRKFGDILERMGYQLEWMDQTTRCDHCGGCIRTDASYYGDTAHYAILGECEAVCEHCIRKDFIEEYLEGLENNSSNAVHIRGINPALYGYSEVECGFENGFHPGQNDDPKAIYKDLKSRGYDRILFEVSSVGQFDIHFCVWAAVTPISSMGVIEYEGDPVDYPA